MTQSRRDPLALTRADLFDRLVADTEALGDLLVGQTFLDPQPPGLFVVEERRPSAIGFSLTRFHAGSL